MSILSTVLCKTAGIAGASAVIYDAYSVGKANSKRTSDYVNADYFERIHTTKRSLTNESPVSNAIQSKVTDLRYNNPIVPVFGKAKGFISGALTSLGNNLLPVSLATLAITSKGVFAKIGAWGVVGCGIYTALKEGFGVGKNSPKY